MEEQNKRFAKKLLMSGGKGMLMGTGAGYLMQSAKGPAKDMGKRLNPANKGIKGPLHNKLIGDLSKELDEKYFPYIVGGGMALKNMGSTTYKELKQRRKENKS